MEPKSYLEAIFPPYDRGGRGRTTRGGFTLERQVVNRLKAAGATVIKSGGSRGAFDVVAVVEPHFVLGIQIKRGLEFKWESPVLPFGCFVPVLLQRLPNQWTVQIVTPTKRSW